MRYATGPLLLLLLLLAAAGCGVETDDRPATFTYIHAAIVRPSCAKGACHSAQNRVASRDLDDRDAAYRLFNEGSPSNVSAIYQVIGGDATPPLQPYTGGRMPLDAPLPSADIELIGIWIDNGSRND